MPGVFILIETILISKQYKVVKKGLEERKNKRKREDWEVQKQV